MFRMIRFELQKMFERPIVIGSLVALLLVSFVLLQAYCFNNSRTTALLPDGTTLSGREAILYNQSVAGKYDGAFTDEAVARMVSDFEKDYPQDFCAMTHDEGIHASLPSVYSYLTIFIPPQNYTEILQEAAAQGNSISPLTEYGLISIADYMPLADTTLQYGYSDSWEFFFMSFCGSTLTIAIPVLLVIIIAVSMVFSSEYSMKTDALILTTKHGKNKQITAKLWASLIFATLVISGVFILFCIAFRLQYGLAGWNTSIQTNFGLSLMAIEMPLNNLQLLLLGFLIVWAASIFTASITAVLSAITKTPFSSLIVALVVFGLPGIIRQMLNQNPLRDILIAFPINAVNVQEVLRLPINAQSIFYNHPYAPAASIGMVTLCILILSSATAHTAFRNHQPL